MNNAALVQPDPVQELAEALRALLVEAESLHQDYNDMRIQDGYDAIEQDVSFSHARAALAKVQS